MTARPFNWNFTTAHRLGESHVRENRLTSDNPRIRDTVSEETRNAEREQADKSGLLPNIYA